jgi:hypothetical protein
MGCETTGALLLKREDLGTRERPNISPHARIFFDKAARGNFLVILKGYIDESYGPPERPKFFTLACTFSDIHGWPKIESAWKKCLAAKNKELAARPQAHNRG